MRAFLAALLALTMKAVSMAQAQSTEKLIFEKPPYLTAAKAISAGDTATLERLIAEGLDVNYEGRDTNTPWGLDTVTLLLWAALKDQTACAELLLKAGADASKGTRRGFTPLMMSLPNGKLFALLLVHYKANPNTIYEGGLKKSPLVLALENRELGEKRFERAEMLLKYGANVNLDLDRGQTAVIFLTALGHWRAVLWVLEHGANPEARNYINATMMGYLRDSYEVNPILTGENQIYRDKVRDWLLAHGIDRSRLDPAIHPEPDHRD